jgi:hypothetical protein
MLPPAIALPDDCISFKEHDQRRPISRMKKLSL